VLIVAAVFVAVGVFVVSLALGSPSAGKKT